MRAQKKYRTGFNQFLVHVRSARRSRGMHFDRNGTDFDSIFGPGTAPGRSRDASGEGSAPPWSRKAVGLSGLERIG